MDVCWLLVSVRTMRYTLQKAEEYTVHNVHCSEGVACTAMRLIISLVLLCLVGEITCPALDSCIQTPWCSYQWRPQHEGEAGMSTLLEQQHWRGQRRSGGNFWLQPMTTTAWRRRRRVHLTRAATLTWSTQIRWVAAAYSLSHSYMTANSDVCITTYLVIDAAPSVHTMSADFMIFPADGITSRNVTISVLA